MLCKKVEIIDNDGNLVFEGTLGLFWKIGPKIKHQSEKDPLGKPI